MNELPRVLIATTTWNAIDIVELFLTHYERMGVAAVVVTDFGSTDGTREALHSSRWSHLVHNFDLPSLATDTSNEMLAFAQSSFPDAWCLFCDPDELLVTPAMQIGDACAAAIEQAKGAALIPRRNVTARRSVAESSGDISPTGALTLRIDQQHARSWEERMSLEPLSPPWIFTAIPGKVLVRLAAARFIESGDHRARLASEEEPITAEDCCLLHYPFRHYELFEEKVEQARLDFEANDYPPGNSWQYQRWIAYRESGRLRDDYLAQFVDDDELPTLLANGAIEEDTRVREFLRAQSIG